MKDSDVRLDAENRKSAERMFATERSFESSPADPNCVLYKPYQYDHPMMAITVDLLVTANTHILLVERLNDPHKGCFALPGGFVDQDESIDEAAVRELKEETGICADTLEFLGWYDNPKRDTRCRVVSMAFHIDCGNITPWVHGNDDVKNAQWLNRYEYMSAVSESRIAFDHDYIIGDAIDWGVSRTDRGRIKGVNIRTGGLPRC